MDFLTSAQCPQDAKLIALILRSMGVTQYDPAVVVQLLEFTHRYAIEILSDSMQYAAHTESKQTIEISDLKLAIQARVNTSFTPAPSREILHSLAAAKNALPLPQPPKRAGAILPPPELRLAAPNWHLAIGKSAQASTTEARADEVEREVKRAKVAEEEAAAANAPPARQAAKQITIVTSKATQ